MVESWYESAHAGLRRELQPMLRLAVPVVLTEIGWMAMGIVDTMMVGRVSAEAIGAVSVGSSLFFSVAIFGVGMLLGMDYVVARAVGGGRMEEAHTTLLHGGVLAILLSAGLMAILLAIVPHSHVFGVHDAAAYLRAVTWSLPALLLTCALHRYMQALGTVRAVMVIVLSANVVNAIADWVFVFGHLGFPAYGAEGAGWATCASRIFMLVGFAGYTVWDAQRRDTGLLRMRPRFEAWRLRELANLGTPAAIQRILEVGVFASATLLAAGLAPAALAAHQIAINAAALTFMVPFGISSAAAVRVGHALGAGDPDGAVRSGWTAFFLSGVLMLITGVVFVIVPEAILRIFTTDSAAIATGVSLLAVAAMFQLFDGIQVVATGVLRGIGDTRTAMIANLVGHWIIGLPIGYALGIWWGGGVVGLWVGLCVGLIAVAVLLTVVWMRSAERLGAWREVDVPPAVACAK